MRLTMYPRSHCIGVAGTLKKRGGKGRGGTCPRRQGEEADAAKLLSYSSDHQGATVAAVVDGGEWDANRQFVLAGIRGCAGRLTR